MQGARVCGAEAGVESVKRVCVRVSSPRSMCAIQPALQLNAIYLHVCVSMWVHVHVCVRACVMR